MTIDSNTRRPDRTLPFPRLWHVSELDLQVDDVIPPGRWGQIVIRNGAYNHLVQRGSPHFYREHLIEMVRVTSTQVPVSRLACAFAYESKATALGTAADRRHACYEVVPFDAAQPVSRHDMTWVTVMGEPGRVYEEVERCLQSYWAGEEVAPHAGSTPEWLIASGLRVIDRVA